MFVGRLRKHKLVANEPGARGILHGPQRVEEAFSCQLYTQQTERFLIFHKIERTSVREAFSHQHALENQIDNPYFKTLNSVDA